MSDLPNAAWFAILAAYLLGSWVLLVWLVSVALTVVA